MPRSISQFRVFRSASFIPMMLALTASAALLPMGCTSRPSPHAAPEALSGNIQTYPLKGVVVGSDPATGEVSIDSEAIPGFMGAMVMPYKLAQPNVASELHPGDHISARLQVSDSASQIDQIVVTSQSAPDYKPAVVYNVPTAGQQVPNFQFLNQSGKIIDISQFRGKVLLVTFIYTRCPLPDYCLRMSQNFSQIERNLRANPELYRQTHLLSISFDPGYDTPKVLRAYAESYVGKPGARTFSHWDFAAPSQSDLGAVDKFFDVGVTPGDNHTLTHSLSTVVIDPSGKIVSWYPSNDWKPEDVVKTMEQALAPQQKPSPS